MLSSLIYIFLLVDMIDMHFMTKHMYICAIHIDDILWNHIHSVSSLLRKCEQSSLVLYSDIIIILCISLSDIKW